MYKINKNLKKAVSLAALLAASSVYANFSGLGISAGIGLMGTNYNFGINPGPAFTFANGRGLPGTVKTSSPFYYGAGLEYKWQKKSVVVGPYLDYTRTTIKVDSSVSLGIATGGSVRELLYELNPKYTLTYGLQVGWINTNNLFGIGVHYGQVNIKLQNDVSRDGLGPSCSTLGNAGNRLTCNENFTANMWGLKLFAEHKWDFWSIGLKAEVNRANKKTIYTVTNSGGGANTANASYTVIPSSLQSGVYLKYTFN